MAQKITDEYGNTVGKIESNSINNYVVRDNYGNKVVTAEKEFLGENYEIRDNKGNLVAKTEKEIFGNKTFVKDRSGRTIGSFGPSGEIGNGVFIALAAVAIFAFLSITSVPDILGDAGWILGKRSDGSIYFNLYFVCITLPVIVMGLINIIFILLKKNLFPNAKTFFQKLLCEIFLGAGLYLGSFIIVIVTDIASGEKVIETIFMTLILAIYFLFSYLLLMIPLALVFTLIPEFTRKKNKQYF